MGTHLPDRSYVRHKNITISYTDHELSGSGANKYLTPVTRYKDVSIYIHVDTSPVVRSVESCCDSVDYLTGAVATFKTMEVLEKQAATEKIVDTATSGFTSMIEQSINMQNAGHKAEVAALSGELFEQCKELEHKHDVMENDYNRKKSRYVSLFENLNKELHNRIHFLMKPCFDFVAQTREQQGRRIDSDLLSTATVGVRESEAARIAIQASKVKNNAMRLIMAAKEQIISRIKMEQVVRQVAVEGCENCTYYMPVMLLQYKDDKETAMRVITNDKADSCVHDSVEGRLSDFASQPLSKEDQLQVDNYFSGMLDTLNDGTPQARRLIETMRQLYANTEFVKYVNQ